MNKHNMNERAVSPWIYGAAFALVVIGAPVANADLVYEFPNSQAAPAPQNEAARTDDRESTRAALKTSKKMVDSSAPLAMESEAVTTTTTTTYAPQATAAPSESLSRSELLRRERMREELNNEDLVQERLEQLRLRDEQKRLDQMFNAKKEEAPAPAPVVMQEQTIVAPPTDAEYDANEELAAPAPQPKRGKKGAKTRVNGDVYGDQMSISQANAVEAEAQSSEEATKVRVSPRAGLANMSSLDTLKVNARFATGVGLDISAGDRVAFELGYTYNVYGIEMNYGGFQSYPGWGAPNGNYETRAFKQNVFDVGLKAYLVGPDAKFRPFVSGGGGYSKGYLNFDDQYRNWMQQYSGNTRYSDYEISSFLGQIGGGFEVVINKSISVGASFKYYKVLSASESNGLPPQAFWGAGNYGYYGYNGFVNQQQSDAGNQYAGNSLARQSFYSVLAGVTFSF